MHGVSKILDGARMLACAEAGLLVQLQLNALRQRLEELAQQVDTIPGPELASMVCELAITYGVASIAEIRAHELLMTERKHWVGKERELQRARDRMRVYRRKRAGD